jgi:alpha-glucosidase
MTSLEGRAGAPDLSPWWRRGVVYQVYPRSFADSNGDGIGDLEGLRRGVDHLAWLGVDAVWLSPVYRSPMADFGYDVADHCAIDPVFGDLATMDALVAACHEAGLRVMLDWVPNHTSEQHPWFRESRSSRTSPKRDWYVWRDAEDGAPPTNWRAAFGGSAWTWDEHTGQWYLHLFLPQQPDLNWRNEEVVAAQQAVLRFWLNRGIDGFRADVVHLIGKDAVLTDQPPELAHLDLVGTHDHPHTHELLRGVRRVLDHAGGERAMVGEVNLGTAGLLRPYYGAGDELHLVFNFGLLRAPWDASAWAAVIEEAEVALPLRSTWPTWVLSNHDTPRHRTRFGGSEARARAAAVVLLTLRGTPFLYAGEELGLLDAVVPPSDRVDPGGRDGCRAPIPWTPDPDHGWPAEPWLPWPPEAIDRNVASERADRASMMWLYRRLLRARRASPALEVGSWRRRNAESDILAYERVSGDDVRLVVANFHDEPSVGLSGAADMVVEISSLGDRDGTPWDGRVRGNEAVVLRPAG